jgi:hypothetical protein
MDEVKSRAYRRVADCAVYVFWAIWGAGAGATAVVFVSASSPTGEALKIFLAFLGAGMSAVAAFVATRAADALVDTRKRRRILRSAIVDVWTLLGALQVFRELRPQVEAHGRDPHSLSSLFSLAQHVWAGAKAPELHEVLETNADVVAAQRLTTVCRSINAVFSPAQGARTTDERRSAALYFLDDSDIERKSMNFTEVLESSGRHINEMLSR